jgi:hypothetical protein
MQTSASKQGAAAGGRRGGGAGRESRFPGVRFRIPSTRHSSRPGDGVDEEDVVFGKPGVPEPSA